MNILVRRIASSTTRRVVAKYHDKIEKPVRKVKAPRDVEAITIELPAHKEFIIGSKLAVIGCIIAQIFKR